jgi:hypothetical protein
MFPKIHALSGAKTTSPLEQIKIDARRNPWFSCEPSSFSFSFFFSAYPLESEAIMSRS